MHKFGGFPPEKQTWNFPTLLDNWVHLLSGAEFKVLWYIIRHTYGWQKTGDSISYKQFQQGIQKQDGTWLDRGTGLGIRAIAYSLKRLEEMGFIERTAGSERGKIGFYKLKFADETPAKTEDDPFQNEIGTRAKMKLPPCKNERGTNAKMKDPPCKNERGTHAKMKDTIYNNQSLSRQSLSPLPSLSKKKTDKTTSSTSDEMRERLFSRFRKTFPNSKLSDSFLEKHIAKIDYLLFLVEKGEINPKDIRSLRAYLQAMTIEESFPEFEKREKKKLAEEEKKKAEESERESIDHEKGKQNIKNILDLLARKESPGRRLSP